MNLVKKTPGAGRTPQKSNDQPKDYFLTEEEWQGWQVDDDPCGQCFFYGDQCRLNEWSRVIQTHGSDILLKVAMLMDVRKEGPASENPEADFITAAEGSMISGRIIVLRPSDQLDKLNDHYATCPVLYGERCRRWTGKVRVKLKDGGFRFIEAQYWAYRTPSPASLVPEGDETDLYKECAAAYDSEAGQGGLEEGDSLDDLFYTPREYPSSGEQSDSRPGPSSAPGRSNDDIERIRQARSQTPFSGNNSKCVQLAQEVRPRETRAPSQVRSVVIPSVRYEGQVLPWPGTEVLSEPGPNNSYFQNAQDWLSEEESLRLSRGQSNARAGGSREDEGMPPPEQPRPSGSGDSGAASNAGRQRNLSQRSLKEYRGWPG